MRAEMRRKHRKRNLTVFGIVTLIVLLTVALVTWGAVSGKKVSPKRRTAGVKTKAPAARAAREQATEPQSSPASAPSSQPVASKSPQAPAPAAPAPAQVAPVEGSPIYPFTRDGSVGPTIPTSGRPERTGGCTGPSTSILPAAGARPLSVGQTVKAGQQIGAVSGTVQLHFEMYTPGTRARGN